MWPSTARTYMHRQPTKHKSTRNPHEVHVLKVPILKCVQTRHGGSVARLSLAQLTIGWLWWSPWRPPPKPYGTPPPPVGVCMCPTLRPRMGLNPCPLPLPPRPLLPLCGNIPNLDEDRLLPHDVELPLPELVIAVVELRRRGRSPPLPPPPSLAPLDH